MYYCKVSFLVSREGTIIRRSIIPVGKQLIDLQGTSFHLSLHLEFTYMGFGSIHIHLYLHLNPLRVTGITSLE
jgi:hypothetical protein